MYKRPLVLGRGAHPLSPALGIETAVDDVGVNTGNLFFAESTFRGLTGCRRSSYQFSQDDLSGCDCIVITAANWLMPYWDFSDLVSRVEATTLPVFVIGVGAQADDDTSIPQVASPTLRLMSVASERSTTISTRGQFSADVLRHYGIDNVRVTGCPSMLLAGKSGPAPIRDNSPTSWDTVVLHGTRHLVFASEPAQRQIYRFAMQVDANIVLQSELSDMYLSLGQWPADDVISNDIRSRVREEYGAPVDVVSRYLRQRSSVFFDVDNWINYLKGKDFCLGSRVHGTIAALLAGVPSVLLTHDSRTSEMANSMRLPSLNLADFDFDIKISPSQYIDHSKQDIFRQYYPEYRRNFLSFFHENGLNWNEDL